MNGECEHCGKVVEAYFWNTAPDVYRCVNCFQRVKKLKKL